MNPNPEPPPGYRLIPRAWLDINRLPMDGLVDDTKGAWTESDFRGRLVPSYAYEYGFYATAQPIDFASVTPPEPEPADSGDAATIGWAMPAGSEPADLKGGDEPCAPQQDKSHPVSAAQPSIDAVATLPFQARVLPWLIACFGQKIADDKQERNHRFCEEALELVQSCGCTQSEAHQLVDYVFERPLGIPNQEAGGVMVTLAALCLAQGLDMHHAGEQELARIWTKIEKIRAKQAAKPKHSPLPAATLAEQAQSAAQPSSDAVKLQARVAELEQKLAEAEQEGARWHARLTLTGHALRGDENSVAEACNGDPRFQDAVKIIYVEEARTLRAENTRLTSALQIERGESAEASRILKEQDEELAKLRDKNAETEKLLRRALDTIQFDLTDCDQLRTEKQTLERERDALREYGDKLTETIAVLHKERDEARVEMDAAISRGSTECSAKQKAWDELERLRAQLAESEKDRQWRPISEAPKDGTHFLAFIPHGAAIDRCIFVCYYSRFSQRFEIVCATGARFEATHFQPLPEPPKP